MKPLKNKFICPACNGNGFRMITKNVTAPHLKVAIDCEACNNQGEIENDTKNIHALRYLDYVL